MYRWRWVPVDHPLRAIRRIIDRALERISPELGSLYIHFGRPSILPERLLRALVLQALYTIRSERQLMEQLDYNLLYRWFVGLGIDDAVWSPTTFSKNRDRLLLTGNVAAAFFDAVLIHVDTAPLLSDEHFTVDGTLLEAWASQKSSGRETSLGVWMRLADAIARCLAGEIALPPPTWTTLRQLEPFGSVDEAMARARSTTVPRIQPGWDSRAPPAS